MVSLGCSLGEIGCLWPGCGLFYFIIRGCLCPGCGRGLVFLFFAQGEGLGFFGGCACWPVSGVWFDVGSLLCSSCFLLLILGGMAFAIFPVFLGFVGHVLLGWGVNFLAGVLFGPWPVLFEFGGWVPKLGWPVPGMWAVVSSLCCCI